MEGIPMAPDSPADFWDSQKQPPGQFATFAWLLIGVYLFYRHPEAWFLSWQAAVYFVVGMFVAAVVFGWLGYGLQRLTSTYALFFIRRPSKGAAVLSLSLGSS
jgi:hypothetical protein